LSYLAFLGVFIAPPLLLLAVAPGRPRVPRLGIALLALPLIALVYTTPWDNYLVARGVWGYGSGRVLGTIGYVPVEEYLFMLAQPLLAVGWLARCRLHEAPPGTAERGPLPFLRARTAGTVVWLCIAVVGALLLAHEPTRYLGLILAWAAPVLAAQWWFTGDVPLQRSWRYASAVVVPVLYLWLTDAIAIRLGTWSISERYTTGIAPLGLPVEEMTFFLVTHLLSVHGALLLLEPRRLARGAARVRA
jgi:lycopene cyclase domain-containing protein